MPTTERYSANLAPWTGAFGSLAPFKPEGSSVLYDNDSDPRPPNFAPETWLDLLAAESKAQNDTSEIITSIGFRPNEIPDYGEEGWTLWTKHRVYFPEVYDGTYAVRSVSRDPSNQITYPVGGGN